MSTSRTEQGYENGFPDLTPLNGPVAVIETERTLPVGPVAFAHAKIVKITAGRVRVRTETGERVLGRGDALVLGSGKWAEAVPTPAVRTWTTCIDEKFLRHHMSWVLSNATTLKQGLHPDHWDGNALYLRADPVLLAKVEPLLRQMSVVVSDDGVDEVAALIALFARVVQISVPTLIGDTPPPTLRRRGTARLALSINPHIARATEALHARLDHPWTTEELASRAVMSRSQMNRVFQRHVGIGPMQFLNELRLTAFTRLIEETSLPVESAARQVGWDRRTALRHFSRRHRTTPTEFRAQPGTVLAGESPCLLCPDRICARSARPSAGSS